MVVDRVTCNRDRISSAKSINLVRIVDVDIVVVSTSFLLFESISVVEASVELISAICVTVTSDSGIVLISGFSEVVAVLVTVVVSVVFSDTSTLDVTSTSVIELCILLASELVVVEASVVKLTSSWFVEPLSDVEVRTSSASVMFIVVSSVACEDDSVLAGSVTGTEPTLTEICSRVEDSTGGVESVLVEICSVVESDSALVEACSVLEDGSALVKTESVVVGVSGTLVVTAGVEFSGSSDNLGVCVLS